MAKRKWQKGYPRTVTIEDPKLGRFTQTHGVRNDGAAFYANTQEARANFDRYLDERCVCSVPERCPIHPGNVL